MRMKSCFHVNGCALSLTLKERLEATRKLPIGRLEGPLSLAARAVE